MKYIVKVFMVLSLALFINGCSTLADSIASRGKGRYKLYEKPYDLVWNEVLEVIEVSKLQLVVENKEKGEILAQRGISALSYGDNVAVFVETKEGVERTKVEVVSKRALATTVFAKDWETYILEELDERLE